MDARILVPLNGSMIAEQALPHAVAQAERIRSDLILLRAVAAPANGNGLIPMEPGWVQDQASEWVRVECIATRVRTPGVPVKVFVIRDPPHEAIIQLVETNDVDLIVICSGGQSGPSRWLMGSVVDRVVREATVPVLLVAAPEKKHN
jgi:nucleotide-binding universal stress UspA family protein